ncbi:MAG: HlyD family efflux transporter periplasmic adaptor subunit [Bryobacterales bacterium]|nr:HlyD family efflux transporter periplasmic adaptor subunit [Bryobacteraceae bacterium]MDW8355840.1 HlyD family efflux transporter periplasmic adaptor subunit [Bryobacterales bacterium]
MAALMVAAVVAGYALWKKPWPVGSPAAAAAVRTATATVGPLDHVLRLAGQTSATNYANITVPIFRGREGGQELTLIKLAKAGAMVAAGDVVAELDSQALQDHIDDVQSTINQADADIKKRRAEHLVDWENLQQTLRLARADWEKAQLDLKASEVRTVIDQEILRLNAEEAEARYKQLQRDLATRQEIQRAEIRILEITRDRHIRHRDRHVQDLKRFTFTAPISGMVVMQTFFRAGEMAQVQLGDQVQPGQTFMKIVDPTSMQVDAEVNQVDAEKLRVGQPATVRLDAFPEVVLEGRVFSIGAMGVRSWRENYYIRTIPVKVRILGTHPRLIPDLSASADVIVDRKENAVLVPLEAVHAEGAERVVYVKRGENFERRVVELAGRNATHAAVASGLRPGEQVALERPPAARKS